MRGSRRVGLSRRAGFRGFGNGAPFNPLTNPATLEWFDTGLLTPGAVSAMTGRKAGIALAQATGVRQPTASATSFNSGPGLSFDGGDVLTIASTTAFASLTAVRIVFAAIDATDVVAVTFELTDNASATDGGFQLDTESSGKIGAYARGTVGIGGRTAAESLASARYVSLCPDTSLSTGCTFIRVNGVAQTLTTSLSACAAGSLASPASFSIGAHSSALSGWTGTMGRDILILTGNAQDADLTAAENFVRSRSGL